jgi:hypothetical protein
MFKKLALYIYGGSWALLSILGLTYQLVKKCQAKSEGSSDDSYNNLNAKSM